MPTATMLTEGYSAHKQMEDELQEFKHFFNHSHDLSCVVKPDGTVDRINAQFEKGLGYTKIELMGQHFLAFIHREDLTITLTEMDKLVNGYDSTNFLNRCRKKDGTYVWLEWNTGTDPISCQ